MKGGPKTGWRKHGYFKDNSTVWYIQELKFCTKRKGQNLSVQWCPKSRAFWKYTKEISASAFTQFLPHISQLHKNFFTYISSFGAFEPFLLQWAPRIITLNLQSPTCHPQKRKRKEGKLLNSLCMYLTITHQNIKGKKSSLGSRVQLAGTC
jgi:hypothetical protein